MTSDVPGPAVRRVCDGGRAHRSRMIHGFGPLSGAAANITLFSYDGQIQIGVNTDRAAVPDPDVLVSCLQDGLHEVLSAA